MNIGLTGGIACGKSTVSAMLVRRGAILVDADQIAREVVEPGSPVLHEVAEQFGNEVLLLDGSLNRKKLGELIFGNDEARKKLDSLLHPPIRALMRGRMAAFEQLHPDKLVVVDVPLLYESGLEYMFDKILVVFVPRDVQLQRLVERDKLSLEQAEARLKAQMDIELKRERADIVIDNRGTLEETEKQIGDLWRRMGLS
jgi:dephospho-CoA kinase